MCPNKDQVERGNPFPQFSYLLLLRAARGLMALFVTMDLLTHAQFDVSEASVAFSTEFLRNQFSPCTTERPLAFHVPNFASCLFNFMWFPVGSFLHSV